MVKQIGSLVVVLALFVGVIFAWNSFTTVGVGKEKAGALFGQVYDKPLPSGWYFVNPLASFETYDLQAMTEHFDDIGMPAQDKLKTVMDMSVTGNFIAGKTTHARTETGSAVGFMNTHYFNRIRAIAIEVGKQQAVLSEAYFDADTLGVVEDMIIAKVNDELNPKGYMITAVKFSDIRLPKVVKDAVEKTKKRDQEVEEQSAKLEIADLLAQEKTKIAEAADASAEFEASAIMKIATAQADANKLLNRSLTAELIEYRRIEKWNGVRSTHVLGDDTSFILQ
jgi:regulator of protease activity HflC (stomatin/prohibitin superfamily)